MERKVEATTGDQLTVPVYCAVAVMVVTGVAPVTGALTPGIAAMLMVVLVAGKSAETTPELIGLVAVAPLTVKKFTATPVSVKPEAGVRVIVAV